MSISGSFTWLTSVSNHMFYQNACTSEICHFQSVCGLCASNNLWSQLFWRNEFLIKASWDNEFFKVCERLCAWPNMINYNAQMFIFSAVSLCFGTSLGVFMQSVVTVSEVRRNFMLPLRSCSFLVRSQLGWWRLCRTNLEGHKAHKNTVRKGPTCDLRRFELEAGEDGDWTVWRGRCCCTAGWVVMGAGHAPRRLSTQTLSHRLSPTSSSISLTAGESENNRAAHNTVAGCWQWP